MQLKLKTVCMMGVDAISFDGISIIAAKDLEAAIGLRLGTEAEGGTEKIMIKFLS